MSGIRPRPDRARAFAGGGALRRLLVAGVALALLVVESLALAPAAHGPGGRGCAHRAPCHAAAHRHEPGRDGKAHEAPESGPEESGGPGDDCALCRVLAAVPTPPALPPSLPRPEAVPTPSAGASAAFVPACVLALGLARGPPVATRR